MVRNKNSKNFNIAGKDNSVQRSSYNDYVKAGEWRCPESPTGAHYWVELVGEISKKGIGLFMCKYCSATKEMPTSITTSL